MRRNGGDYAPSSRPSTSQRLPNRCPLPPAVTAACPHVPHERTKHNGLELNTAASEASYDVCEPIRPN